MKTILSLLFFTMLLSLKVANAEALKITSEPSGADIYVRSLNDKNKTKVGVTPFDGSVANLATQYGKNGLFMVVIEKEGHESNSIILSDIFKGDLDLYVNLDVKVKVEEKKKEGEGKGDEKNKEEISEKLKALEFDFKKMDFNVNQMFEAQRLMRAQQYDEAINLLKRAEVDQAQLSIIPELIGSAYYLKRDMRASLVWYEKAYRMNLENKDAFTMKEYLRKALGLNNEK